MRGLVCGTPGLLCGTSGSARFSGRPTGRNLDQEEFEVRVREATRSEGWIVDGNYSERIRGISWGAADTVVWVDLPRGAVRWLSGGNCFAGEPGVLASAVRQVEVVQAGLGGHSVAGYR